MPEKSTVPGGNITFAGRLNGYDREQVDKYIRKLADAYRKAFAENAETAKEYKMLQEENAMLKSEVESRKSAASAISKTLLDAELAAQQIINDAHKEAERIKSDACIERIAANRSIEAANEYLRDTIGKLQLLSGKISRTPSVST